MLERVGQDRPIAQAGGAPVEPGGKQGGGRGGDVGTTADFLDSWKDIARYLQRDVRTVMRWERTRGLPVHRLPGGKKAAVYALKSELEAWRATAPGPEEEASQDGTVPATTNTQARPPATAPAAAVPVVTLHRISRPRLRASRLLLALLAFSMLPAAIAAFLLLRPSWRDATPAPLPIRSLVVLPFENLGKDPAQDYLVDGVHDALITDLARAASSSGLQVKSRATAMHYRGKAVPIGVVARELRVDAVVEGTVMRAGDRILVNVQLIRAANEDHLWASRYERHVGDALDLVTELSRAIRGEIQLAVAGQRAAAAPARASRPVRPDVVDTYLRAKFSYHLLTREGLETARSLYQRTLGLDPTFAPAWTGLALTRTAQVFVSGAPAELLPTAREAAAHALALDPSQAEATGILSYVALYWDWDFARAGKALEEAVRRTPDSQMVRHAYADYLMVTGDVASSLEQVREMQRADPAAWPPRGIFLYHAHAARRYDEVIREGRALAGLFPGRLGLHYRLAVALWMTGRREEAMDEWAQSLGPDGEPAARAMRQALARRDFNGVLSRLADASAAVARQGESGAVTAASLYAAAGNASQAFAWLEQSFSRRDPSLLHIVADPLFDPIRSDARFRALLRRIGIPH